MALAVTYLLDTHLDHSNNNLVLIQSSVVGCRDVMVSKAHKTRCLH